MPSDVKLLEPVQLRTVNGRKAFDVPWDRAEAIQSHLSRNGVGTTLCVRLLLLAALGLLFERSLRSGMRRGDNDIFAGVIAVAIAATFAGVGHASTTRPSWPSMILDGLHLLAMATWLGGLVILVFCCIEGDPGANQYGPSPKLLAAAAVIG